MRPSEPAESFEKPLDKCPNCGGQVKDYNAETVIITPETMRRIRENPASAANLSILYICHECGGKFFAPPANRE